MNERNFRNYIIFWLSQTVSQLGSAMTGYALIIWAYQQTNSALSVSLMSFCSFVPYVIVSIFAGPFIDRHKKKKIMAISDTVAFLCSLGVFMLLISGQLCIWHIYVVNTILGFMGSFQSPATSVAVGLMVPKDKYDKVSGMDSFASNLVTVSAPMLAAVVLSVFKMRGVILIDLCSFLFAITILIFKVQIKEDLSGNIKDERYFNGFWDGLNFLKQHKGILNIMLSMALINFFSRLTYENILSPMLIARSGGNSIVYGIVSAMLGIGGILGGILVTTKKMPKDKIKMIYYFAAISFLSGDLLMGIGRNVYVWSIAGLAASIPIPFIMAGQRTLLFETVPQSIQGRVFSVRNAIQFSTIPIGIILGGILADYVFEPFMSSQNIVAVILGKVVGNGAGSGMAVMFLCTGVLGFITSMIGYRNKNVRTLANK